MEDQKLTLSEKISSPTPEGWKSASMYAKSAIVLGGFVGMAFPPALPIIGVVSAVLGAFSWFCSTRVDHDALDTLNAAAESPEIQKLVEVIKAK